MRRVQISRVSSSRSNRCTGRRERDAELGVLLVEPGRAERHLQPSVRGVVDGEHLRGEHRRVPVGRAGDEQPEPDARRLPGQRRERGDALVGLARARRRTSAGSGRTPTPRRSRAPPRAAPVRRPRPTASAAVPHRSRIACRDPRRSGGPPPLDSVPCIHVMNRDMAARAGRTYSSPLRAEQAEQTRARIVQAAVDLLGEGDAGDLSMADVAERAGVSVRTVYRSFATKDELLDAVIEWINDAHRRRAGPPPARRASDYEAGPPGWSTALFEIEPLYRALFATSAGRASHRRTAPMRRESIAQAYAAEMAGLDDDAARRFGAVLHLVASSNGALFMKDYWDLSATGRGTGRAVGDQGPGRRGQRPQREGGAVTAGKHDHHVGGTGGGPVGAGDPAHPGRGAPPVPGAGTRRAARRLRVGVEALRAAPRVPGRPVRERPLLHAHAPGGRARAEARQGEQRRRRGS